MKPLRSLARIYSSKAIAIQHITAENCEQYFVLYADDELNNLQKASVEEFVYHHPRFQAIFELIQQTKLTPDQGIVFPDKKLLYRDREGPWRSDDALVQNGRSRCAAVARWWRKLSVVDQRKRL